MVVTNALGVAFTATLLAASDAGVTFAFPEDGATNALAWAQLAPASRAAVCDALDFAPVPPPLAAMFAYAQGDLRRVAALVADERLDAAEARARAAEEKLDTAQAKLDVVQAKLDTVQAMLDRSGGSGE